MINTQTIVIIDISGKCDQAVARAIRSDNVYCKFMSDRANVETILMSKPIGIVIIGEADKTELYELIMVQNEVPVLDLVNRNFINSNLHSFLYDTCKATGEWTIANYAISEIESLRAKIGNKMVLCGLSGGVDSTVCATLIHKAAPNSLKCILVDHGLMRLNETKAVVETFAKLGIDVKCVDAEDRFLSKLAGVIDPERKRKIIGEEFIRVFEDEGRLIGKVEFLMQGTIYPDIIESGIGSKGLVKSHHNVGGLPDVIDFEEILEPLKDLFKDEVRALGLELGLSEELVMRQPFPGPGLGVRVIGELTKPRLDILREADAIFCEEIAIAGLDKSIWQYFAVLTNLQSVGVRDEVRTYENTLALRAIHSIDAMTAEYAKIPYAVLDKVSSRITTEVKGINRIVYDITCKPPSTIEWE